MKFNLETSIEIVAQAWFSHVARYHAHLLSLRPNSYLLRAVDGAAPSRQCCQNIAGAAVDNPLIKKFTDVLADHKFFSSLDPDELAELASCGSSRLYHRGQTIFLKGEFGDSLMAVLRGRVKVSAVSNETDVREVAFNVIGPGEIVGEIATLDGQERTANATAIEPTELLILPRAAFLSFLSGHPAMAMDLINILCERLRQTSDFVEDLRFRDVPKRLARRLLWLARRAKADADEGAPLEIKIRQEDLAEFAGIARETTTKQIGAWRKIGILQTAKGSIRILDLPKLEEIAGRDANDIDFDLSA